MTALTGNQSYSTNLDEVEAALEILNKNRATPSQRPQDLKMAPIYASKNVEQRLPIGFNAQSQAKAGLITTGVLLVAFGAVAVSQTSLGQSLMKKAGWTKESVVQSHANGRIIAHMPLPGMK